MSELAIKNNGRVPMEGAVASWPLYDNNLTVIGLPDNDPSGEGGLYAWILSHLHYPLYERCDIHEVFEGGNGWRLYRFIRNACLVDICDKAERVIFVPN